MKSIIVCFVALFAIISSSCEGEDKPVVESPSGLELVSSPTETVGNQGGVFAVRYVISSPSDDAQVAVSSDNTDMISSVEVISEDTVKVVVAANKTDAERQGTVTIEYKDESVSVLFVQEPMDSVVVVANQLIGNYYGERLCPGLGYYWIIMSDGGIVDGEATNGSEFFRIDLIAPMAEDEDSIRIPDGYYRYDATNSLEAYTIPNLGNTDFSYIDDGGMAWAEPFVDASLEVSGSRFTLKANTENSSYYVTFEGEYTITANIISDNISTLEEDLEIDLTGCVGTLSNYGDYWLCGYTNWGIEFVHSKGLKYGTYLVLDFISESTTSCVGTYRYSGFSGEDSTKPNFAPGFYIPGMRISDDGVHMMGSLVQINRDGKGIAQAPLYGGEFTISQNEDGTYHIVIDAVDDAEPANRITLDWTGRL